MVNSRQKGKVGERQARDAAKAHWFAGAECIRAAQSNGKFSEDLLNALPGVHVEVKWYEKIAPLKWLRRALLDSRGSPAAVVMRENGDTGFSVLLRMADSVAFMEALWQARDRAEKKWTYRLPAGTAPMLAGPASGTSPAPSAAAKITSPSTTTTTDTASPKGARSTKPLPDRTLTLLMKRAPPNRPVPWSEEPG